MSSSKTRTKALIRQLVCEELNEAGLGDFLTKPMFAKKPEQVKREKRLDAEQRARALFSDIGRTLADVPQDLEGKIRTLRDIKEKISQVLIWGEEPLLDLIKETKE
jgi:hypothetical protein